MEALEAVVGVAAGPEVGVDEPRLPNKLLGPPGFAPNRPEVAEAPATGEALLAGVCVDSEGLNAPNIWVWEFVVPKRLPPAGFEVVSAGGGPAGVVELPKFVKGLLGAGVVDPAGADVEALEVEPNKFCPAGLFRPPNKLGVDAPPVLFSLLAPGVDAPPSSFCCPKLKPAPNEGVGWLFVPPNNEPVVPVVLAGFPKALPAGAVPVLLPKSDGVDVPEPGLEPVAPPPKKDGAGGFPVLEAPRLANRPPVAGCDVAGVA